MLLHALRLRAGLTQLDLARTAGMSVRADTLGRHAGDALLIAHWDTMAARLAP